MRKLLRKLLEVVLAITAIVCLTLFGKNLFEYHSSKEKEGDLLKEVSLASETSWRDAWKELKSQNEDFQCWLEWDSGLLQTAVMQPTSENADYYMNHDFNKEYTTLGGAAFFSPSTSRDNQNLVIYGHSVFYYGSNTMDLMFSPLLTLRNQSIYEQNKTFWLHWEDRDEQYEVAYVCELDKTECSWEYEQSDFSSEMDFNSWLAEAENYTVVSTNSLIKEDDMLVTFQTCTCLGGTGRCVIVARKVAERK